MCGHLLGRIGAQQCLCQGLDQGGNGVVGEFHPGVRYENRREPPQLNFSLRRAEQLSGELLDLGPGLVWLPLEEAASRTKFLPVDHPLIQTARDTGTGFGD